MATVYPDVLVKSSPHLLGTHCSATEVPLFGGELGSELESGGLSG